MAKIAASETNKFVGISALKVVKGGFAAGFTLGDGQALVEIPVAEESDGAPDDNDVQQG